MLFSVSERKMLLSVKGIGPAVIARLEQLGYSTIDQLSRANMLDIVSQAAQVTGSTCWKNSPQARSAITAIIEFAKQYDAENHR